MATLVTSLRLSYRYEDEIKRLRSLLDRTAPGEATSTAGGPAPPHLPSSNSQGPPPIASGGAPASFQDSYRNGSSSYDRDGRPLPGGPGAERGERERLNSSQGNGNGEAGSNKRMRLEGSGYVPGSPGAGPKKEERDRYGEYPFLIETLWFPAFFADRASFFLSQTHRGISFSSWSSTSPTFSSSFIQRKRT